MPRSAVEEHEGWAPPPPINIYASGDAMVGGGSLTVREGAYWLPKDCFPQYVSKFLASDSLPIWTGSLVADDPKVIEIDEPCAVPLNPNIVYGHFLLEMLPRMFILKLLAKLGQRFKILMNANVARWVKEFANIYFSEHDIIWYDGRSAVVKPRVLYNPSMMHEQYNFHPFMNCMVDDVLSCFGGEVTSSTPAFGPGPRIYFSKSKNPSWHRLTNESDVEAVFADLGFKIIHPEAMSFFDQFNLYRTASCMAGEYSSALHNALFAPRGAAVISLNRINNYQSMVARLRDNALAYIAPSDGQFRDWRQMNPNWRSENEKVVRFEMDCARLRKNVESFLASLEI